MSMGKIANTWSLIKSAWGVLQENKVLFIYPLLSGVSLFLILSFFLFSLWWDPGFRQILQLEVLHPETPSFGPFFKYLLLFVFYIVCYFVMTFFNTSLIDSAIRYMRGEKITFIGGLWAALKRWPQILIWSSIMACVGVFLKAADHRSTLGEVLSSLFGAAFSIASFFVIPVMVAENKNPLIAFKESIALFRKTWGEQLVSYAGFGIVFFVLWIPLLLLIKIAFVFRSSLCFCIAMFYCLAVLLLQSTLQSVFRAALYVYSKNELTPAGFDSVLLQRAFVTYHRN